VLQKILKLKRKPILCFPKIFGGSNYWNLTRTSLEYVIAYTDAYPDFLHRLKYVFAAEEIYFQTILLNSIHSNKIVNDNLRYIDWTSGRGFPAFLDITDFPEIISSNNIFARKFNRKSAELKQMISCNINTRIK
jgi:hypothetical protein